MRIHPFPAKSKFLRAATRSLVTGLSFPSLAVADIVFVVDAPASLGVRGAVPSYAGPVSSTFDLSTGGDSATGLTGTLTLAATSGFYEPNRDPQSFNGNSASFLRGPTSTATWQASGYAPGSIVDVYATWAIQKNLATVVPYHVNGGMTVTKSHQVAPVVDLALADPKGGTQIFELIGSYAANTSGEINVVVDGSGGFTSVDAMAFSVKTTAFPQAKTTTIINSPKQNIFAAGRSTPPQQSGGGGGLLPMEIPLSPGLNRILFFTAVTGSGNFANGRAGYSFDEDGRNQSSFSTNAFQWNGISGIYATDHIGFLTGCFLTENAPVDPAPPRDVFTDVDFPSLSPAVAQLFFIGDGKTASGESQIFRIPDEATRLFLGFTDSADILGGGLPGWYDDNIGQIVSSFRITELDPRLSGVTKAGQKCYVTASNLIPGKTYQLMTTSSPSSNLWTSVQAFVSPPAGVYLCEDPLATEVSKLYRLEMAKP